MQDNFQMMGATQHRMFQKVLGARQAAVPFMARVISHYHEFHDHSLPLSPISSTFIHS